MIGIIGGTGLGQALFGEQFDSERRIETPFGEPSSPIRIVNWHGTQVALLARHGEGHTLNPSQVPYRANLFSLKSLGVTHVLASGAVGSLREDMRPRDLVIVDQVIDKMYRRVPTFFDQDVVAHVEFSEPFCPHWRAVLLAAAERVKTRVHAAGTYVCMEGPAFSTKAESHMHRGWNGDLIGMTLMPEAKLAREAEMAYAMIALVTDYDCWRPHEAGVSQESLLQEIIGHLKDATGNAIALFRAVLEQVSGKPLPASGAHDALKLAIWSKPDHIPRAVWALYGPLLKRYAPKPQ